MRDDQLKLLIDMEYLPAKQSPELPFHMRNGEQVGILDDSDVPDRPVYCVKFGKVYRLRVRVTPDVGCGMRIDNIDAVTVKPSESDSVTLTIEQRRNGDAVVAQALFEPARLGSHRTQTTPIRIGTNEKYVRLEVCVKIVIGGVFSGEVDLVDDVYCKMIRPKARRRARRFLGMIRKRAVLRRSADRE